MHKAGEFELASQLYTYVLQLEPKHADANHNTGVIEVISGRAPKAIPFLRTALEKNPNHGQYWISYIDALIRMDALGDAQNMLTQAKERGAEVAAFDQLEQRIKQLNKKAVGGIKTPSGSFSDKTTRVQDPPQDQQKSLINLYGQGQLKEALEQATILLQQFPNSSVLFNISGAINNGLGQLDASIGAYSKAVAIKPGYAEAYNNMGVTLKEQGKLEEAIEAYEKALTIKPDYAEAYNNMGATLQEQGKLKEAIQAYTKALAIKPGYAEAYNNIGNALKEQGKLEEAIEAYNKALVIEPDYAEAYYNMGNALKEQGKLEEAIEAYNKALAIKPDSSDAFFNLGVVFHQQGKLKRAAESYKQVLCIKPSYAEALYALSGTANDLSEAKGWVENCLQVDKGHLKAKLMLSALRFYESGETDFNNLMQSSLKDHPYMRSFAWAFSLPELPELYFHRWALFDRMVELSNKARPFYEFGVWRGEAFKHLIKTFKKGYGFDTFEGIPEDWHDEKAGTYSSDGNIPKIKGGEFIVGKFEDSLPGFFSEKRPMASIINFDADLYSSTICALNYSQPVIDQHTILIFDEFIINKNWEQDEYKALNEFCLNNNYTHEVLAISFFTKQVAVRLIGI
ncbi:tetratricopeptide repeat protein [Paracoccaceae bacterium]|nr:tetratricopeptide repeat protein [Paracoccaceae bacterium]